MPFTFLLSVSCFLRPKATWQSEMQWLPQNMKLKHDYWSSISLKQSNWNNQMLKAKAADGGCLPQHKSRNQRLNGLVCTLLKPLAWWLAWFAYRKAKVNLHDSHFLWYHPIGWDTNITCIIPLKLSIQKMKHESIPECSTERKWLSHLQKLHPVAWHHQPEDWVQPAIIYFTRTKAFLTVVSRIAKPSQYRELCMTTVSAV